MGRVDKVQVVRPGGNQLVKDDTQAVVGDVFPEAAVADLIVLAERAPQIAAGKEHRARAVHTTDAGFLPLVQRCACDPKGGADAAKAALYGAYRITLARTSCAAHNVTPLSFFVIIPYPFDICHRLRYNFSKRNKGGGLMLLAIDIGNTNINLGCFADGALLFT